MPASSTAHQNHEDQDFQQALTDATFAVEEICSNIEDIKKFISASEKDICKLNKDLVLARKKVVEIKYNRRSMDFFGVLVNETMAERMVSTIKDALRTIDELAKLNFVLPDTIGMALEILIALPENAPSDIAASAYTKIAAEIKRSDVDPKQLSILDHQVLDVVCLAVARFIDHKDKGAMDENLNLAFGGSALPEVRARLWNSYFQVFKRNYEENPSRTPGYKPTDEGKRFRDRTRQRHAKRNTSEPASESRLMTGTSTICFQ